ncbi:MAG: MFS transporter [Desulfobacterium sp.]|nr:MFS transporter [Desulfobacterium sp.]
MTQDRNYPENASGLKNLFRALASRNYRLFFAGQSISLLGAWIQRVAMSWIVYRLTSSEVLLGTVSFLGLIPVFVFSPFAGVLADRINRQRLLVITQVLAMLQALILAGLIMTGSIRIEHIMVLSVFLGLINAFDTPVRQAFTLEMIEKKEDLSNAIALNSALFNSARLVGPAIAGALITVFGEGLCFLLNGLSYLFVIAALLLMRIPMEERKTKQQNLLHGLQEGFSYAFGFTPIRTVLSLLMVVSILGTPYIVLMPIFAKDILHGDAHTLGFLMSATGGGALCGAVYLASRKTVVGLVRILPLAAILFSLGLIGFALSHYQWLSILFLIITGFGMMVQMASSNTILQTIADEDKRGRIVSLYVMCVMGTTPLGSLLAGAVADRIGTPETLMIGGSCCLVCSIIFMRKLPALRASIRPIYVEKGILSEVALGLESAVQWPRPPVG